MDVTNFQESATYLFDVYNVIISQIPYLFKSDTLFLKFNFITSNSLCNTVFQNGIVKKIQPA